jgi:hypothetical protein
MTIPDDNYFLWDNLFGTFFTIGAQPAFYYAVFYMNVLFAFSSAFFTGFLLLIAKYLLTL